MNRQDYPTYLNPFGSDEEEDIDDGGQKTNEAIRSSEPKTRIDEYPSHLSPFGEEDTDGNPKEESKVDDYDNSLNPFDVIEVDSVPSQDASASVSNIITNEPSKAGEVTTNDIDGKKIIKVPHAQSANVSSTAAIEAKDSLGPPPMPLPRTRSLLKKELALRNKQQQQANEQSDNHGASLSISETTDSSIVTNSSSSTNEVAFQRKKNKRNAPPLPVNYKRQVSGSAEAIEEELNNIGDRLAELELESNACQDDLKRSYQINDTEFAIARAKLVEIIRMKNSILRRQKELMYRKREITLDQNHSDIEYELRMIGNKQSSNQTPEDDSREKELLKKLVEIIEEKSDIVENLNRDTSCDIEDVEAALRRMNLSDSSLPKPNSREDEASSLNVPKQKDNCYKSNNLVSGAKFSKIATLLPKGGTLKGTIKLKRKRLFKKSPHIIP